MGTFVPPFTTGVPLTTSVSRSPLVRPRLDDRNTNVLKLPSEQQYGMPTSMMVNVHNSVSAFADQENPFTMHNVHSPSSSSIFGRSTLPPFEGEKNTRRGLNYVFEKFFVSLKNWTHWSEAKWDSFWRNKQNLNVADKNIEREEERHKAIIQVPSTNRK
jgi:hypothetical protein